MPLNITTGIMCSDDIMKVEETIRAAANQFVRRVIWSEYHPERIIENLTELNYESTIIFLLKMPRQSSNQAVG